MSRHERGEGRRIFGRTSPVGPEDIMREKRKSIPKVVIGVFDTLIRQGTDSSGYSYVREEDVGRLLAERGISLAEAKKNKWTQIEPVYTKAGWDVEYKTTSPERPYYVFKPSGK